MRRPFAFGEPLLRATFRPPTPFRDIFKSEFLDSAGISDVEALSVLGLSQSEYDELLCGSLDAPNELFEKIAKLGGHGTKFWREVYDAYRSWRSRDVSDICAYEFIWKVYHSPDQLDKFDIFSQLYTTDPIELAWRILLEADLSNDPGPCVWLWNYLTSEGLSGEDRHVVLTAWKSKTSHLKVKARWNFCYIFSSQFIPIDMCREMFFDTMEPRERHLMCSSLIQRYVADLRFLGGGDADAGAVKELLLECVERVCYPEEDNVHTRAWKNLKAQILTQLRTDTD